MRGLFYAIAFSAVLAVSTAASDRYIDFETLPDGTPVTDLMMIHDQYSHPLPPATYTGVTFYLSDDGINPNGSYPRMAKVGITMTAFEGPYGARPECGVNSSTRADMPAAAYRDTIGCFFLTDNTQVSTGQPPDLVIDYDAPVTVASGSILDIDNDEIWLVIAYRNLVATGDTCILHFADDSAGNGLATTWVMSDSAGFDRLIIRYAGGTTHNIGLAFDNFFTDTPTSGRHCGDADGNAAIDIGDAVYLINYIFKSGPAPDPECVGDANGDEAIDIGDAVSLINYIFKGGPAPVDDCCS